MAGSDEAPMFGPHNSGFHAGAIINSTIIFSYRSNTIATGGKLNVQ